MPVLKTQPFIILKTAWYYVNSIFRLSSTKKNIYNRSFYLNYFKFIKRRCPNHRGFLNQIDVFIPVIERDFEVLKLTVASLRLFCKNPINDIYLVAPNSQTIKEYAERNNCKYIDEKTVIKDREKYSYIVNGADRASWLFQQFLKLNWYKVSKNEYCLIFDADTLLLKDHSFVHNGKINFNCSDEYHIPYYVTFNKLLKIWPKIPVSLIGHYMTFERETTISLKKLIENINDLSWQTAIIKNIDFTEPSGFSEYETYGHYMNEYFSNRICITYQKNLSLKRNEMKDLPLLIEKYSGDYSTLSFHHWYNSI